MLVLGHRGLRPAHLLLERLPSMRIVVRADAGLSQGSGHVMRCLTLAEELSARHHDVHLMTASVSIGWLRDVIASAGYEVSVCELDSLDIDSILALDPDWVVVDSYRVASDSISRLTQTVPVLSIVDGDTRGIRSSLYLEQNLGSEKQEWSIPSGARMLAGSTFALVRDSILDKRRGQPWMMRDVPHVVAFMGGTDPAGVIVPVASALARLPRPVQLTVVSPAERLAEVAHIIAGLPDARVLPPTGDLPTILGDADIVVSAAGTSAWDICTLGAPAVLVAVVENQIASLEQIMVAKLTLGLDIVHDGIGVLEQLPRLVGGLIEDESARHNLAAASLATFDGLGKRRVVDAMEEFGHR